MLHWNTDSSATCRHYHTGTHSEFTQQQQRLSIVQMHQIECRVHPTAQWVSPSTNQLMYTEVNAKSISISFNSCTSLCKYVICCSCFSSCVLMTLGKSCFSCSCLFICVLRTLGKFAIVCFFTLGTSFVFGSDLSLGLIFIPVIWDVMLFSFAFASAFAVSIVTPLLFVQI